MREILNRSKETARVTRKQYSAPRLVEYGHVGKLTQSGGNTHSDGSGNKKVGNT